MACCKCCCGGEDCAEGQEGKCCCGGSSGECCAEGEYCCSGVCQAEPCGECSATCSVTTEVVYFENLTGSYLQHDGDSFPLCNASASLPEQITGTFTLGTSDGCAGSSCGCELKFRFWRNLYSACNSGSETDVTTQTVEVACTAGTVTVHAAGGDYVLEVGESHTFSSIDFDPASGAVLGSSAGECFSVSTTSSSASFSVTATLDWSNQTDHDLYGEISCGACA